MKQVRPTRPLIDLRSTSKTGMDHAKRSETNEICNPPPAKIDRPGFDLGGATGETNAGTGLGLGDDAGEKPADRSLPGRRPRVGLNIPR